MKRYSTRTIVIAVIVGLLVSSVTGYAALKQINQYGDIHWLRGGGPISSWFFGADDEGIDVNMYGETSGVRVQWDQSADSRR